MIFGGGQCSSSIGVATFYVRDLLLVHLVYNSVVYIVQVDKNFLLPFESKLEENGIAVRNQQFFRIGLQSSIKSII